MSLLVLVYSTLYLGDRLTDTSIDITDPVKFVCVTLDSHLCINKHISNKCSFSYFHIHAFRHNRHVLDIEPFKTIKFAIVCWFYTILGLFNLIGISSNNIHRLQRVQDFQVVTHSKISSTSSRASHPSIDYTLATLVAQHCM